MTNDELLKSLTDVRLDIANLTGKVDAYAAIQGRDRDDIKKLEGRVWAALTGTAGAMAAAILSLVMGKFSSPAHVSAITHAVADFALALVN